MAIKRTSRTKALVPSANFHESIAIQTTAVQRWEPRWEAVTSSILGNKQSIALTAYIAGAIGLSQLAFLLNPLFGEYANVAALAALAVMAIRSEKPRVVAIAASILPVATMVNLSLPMPTALSQSAVFYSILFLLALLYRPMFNRGRPKSATSVSGKEHQLLVPSLIVSGPLLGLLAFGMLRTKMPYGGVSELLAFDFVAFAIVEETYFRGPRPVT